MIKSQFRKFIFLGIIFSLLIVNTALANTANDNNLELIPLRETMEKLGVKVQWHSDQSKVSLETEDIRGELIIGKNNWKVIRNKNNGFSEEVLDLKIPPKITNSRTYVAEGFIADFLSASTKWNEFTSTTYENKQYGFNFQLPGSWEGFTIINENWEGKYLDKTKNGKDLETGPQLIIRHPHWALDDKRQDIPIMVFTMEQWNSLQKEEFYIGAAPIGPRELGRNSKYVFALPARYNFAFLTGFEEVEAILEQDSFKII